MRFKDVRQCVNIRVQLNLPAKKYVKNVSEGFSEIHWVIQIIEFILKMYLHSSLKLMEPTF